jgi:hypothetical protein
VLSLVSDFLLGRDLLPQGRQLTDANLKEVMTSPERVFDHVALVARIRNGSHRSASPLLAGASTRTRMQRLVRRRPAGAAVAPALEP